MIHYFLVVTDKLKSIIDKETFAKRILVMNKKCEICISGMATFSRHSPPHSQKVERRRAV
jgi:hypothetical protein